MRVVRDDIEECTVHFHSALVVNDAQLPELIKKKLTRERVAPTMLASVSWLIFGMTGSGLPSFP